MWFIHRGRDFGTAVWCECRPLPEGNSLTSLLETPTGFKLFTCPKCTATAPFATSKAEKALLHSWGFAAGGPTKGQLRSAAQLRQKADDLAMLTLMSPDWVNADRWRTQRRRWRTWDRNCTEGRRKAATQVRSFLANQARDATKARKRAELEYRQWYGRWPVNSMDIDHNNVGPSRAHEESLRVLAEEMEKAITLLETAPFLQWRDQEVERLRAEADTICPEPRPKSTELTSGQREMIIHGLAPIDATPEWFANR